MDSTADFPSFEVGLLQPIPDKTRYKYNNTYDAFIKWQESKGITSFDEEIMLTYFNEASKIYKSSTLWAMYSMLRSTISSKKNIDISINNSRLIAFLKEKSVGFESKKTPVFSADEIHKFLVEAPDEHYLAMKTILIFGVAGSCGRAELTNVKIDYLTDYGTEIIVKIPDTKKDGPKIFMINGEFAKIVQKYMQLRPANVMTDRFFLQYNQGDCISQVMNDKKLAIVPKEIAKFLKLDDYKSYTSHSFRPGILSNSAIKKMKSAKIVESKLQNIALIKSHASKQLATSTNTNSNVNNIISHASKQLATSTNTNSNVNNIISHASKQLATSTNTNSNVNNIILMSQSDAPYDIFYKITNLKEQQTEMSSEPIVSMLPLTTALMKRKSKYYMGLQPNQFLRLLQLASERKQLSDVKLMLALRKLRLNEEFEVLGDLFDLDETTAEQYYHESKDMVIDLVILSITTSTSNHFQVISEPMIKIEESDTPYGPDPIAVTSDNHNSTTEMNVDDHDDFEFSLPFPAGEDRGFLSDDIRKRSAECSVCHKFYAPRLLNQHLESAHFNILNLNRTICGLCWKEFDTKVLLKTHQKDAHGGCSYGCDVCGKLFSSKRYISVHILTKHAQVKTYLCDSCGEGFPFQSSLKSHVTRKHVKRGYDCHLCEMKYVTAFALKDHIRARHTDERPYKCEVKGCGKTFSWPSAFKSHKRVHAEDKYECSICVKLFSFKGNLQNHLKTVHNQILDNKCLTSKFM